MTSCTFDFDVDDTHENKLLQLAALAIAAHFIKIQDDSSLRRDALCMHGFISCRLTAIAPDWCYRLVLARAEFGS